MILFLVINYLVAWINVSYLIMMVAKLNLK
jgi:hypothetical protein